MIEETASTTPRVIGRPRDERADTAILSATLELMAAAVAGLVSEITVPDRSSRGGARH